MPNFKVLPPTLLNFQGVFLCQGQATAVHRIRSYFPRSPFSSSTPAGAFQPGASFAPRYCQSLWDKPNENKKSIALMLRTSSNSISPIKASAPFNVTFVHWEKRAGPAHEQFKGYKKIIKYLPSLFRRLAVEEPGSTVMPIGDKNDAGKSEPQREFICRIRTEGFQADWRWWQNGALYNNSLINKLRMRINPTLVDNLSQGQLKRWIEKYNLPFDIIVELLAFSETLGAPMPLPWERGQGLVCGKSADPGKPKP